MNCKTLLYQLRLQILHCEFDMFNCSFSCYKSSYPTPGLDWPLGLQEVEAREGDKVLSPMHRQVLLPRRYPWYSFFLEFESTPGS